LAGAVSRDDAGEKRGRQVEMVSVLKETDYRQLRGGYSAVSETQSTDAG